MTVLIDSCFLRSRPATNDRAASYTLDILGGSFWFPADGVPAGSLDGPYKGAELEVSLRSATMGSGARSVLVPTSIKSLRK